MSRPQRTRSHVLESVSRSEFSSALVRFGWVVRPFDSSDYGIDDSVEIFEDEMTTGLMFYVQMKSTDTEDLAKALKVRLKTKTIRYFESLNQPVLIVLFHSPSERFYGRWVHRFLFDSSNASATIEFAGIDPIDFGSLQILRDEVAIVRELGSSSPTWPLKVRVCATGQHNTLALCLALQARVGATSPVRFVDQVDRAPILHSTTSFVF